MRPNFSQQKIFQAAWEQRRPVYCSIIIKLARSKALIQQSWNLSLAMFDCIPCDIYGNILQTEVTNIFYLVKQWK